MRDATNVTVVWTVVEVWRGFADRAHVFARASDAHRLYSRLRRRCNFDENDVRIFKTEVVPPESRRPTVSST